MAGELPADFRSSSRHSILMNRMKDLSRFHPKLFMIQRQFRRLNCKEVVRFAKDMERLHRLRKV